VSPIGTILKKLNTGAQSNGIKIVSVVQRLHGEIWGTNSYVQKRDGQTGRQTDKQKTLRFGRPGDG